MSRTAGPGYGPRVTDSRGSPEATRPTGPTYDDLVVRLRAAGCVFAEDEARVLLATTTDKPTLDRLVARRVAGEPLEHVVGWVDFAGVRVALEPGVFVPRRRSELLVDLAATVLATGPARPVVVDLCCGSGALGLALVHRRPMIELHAADSDPAAVACARRNIAPLGGAVHRGDLTDPLPARLRGRVDVLVANVPYVPTSAIALMPHESRDHEPRATVDGGADGLDVVRRLAALAPPWLAEGGTVLVEAGPAQTGGAVDAFTAAGLAATVHDDHDRGATVVVGHRDRVP